MTDLTDYEILKACARACGMLETPWLFDYWDALEDDGDCSQMENKCRVVVDCDQGIAWTWHDGGYGSFTPGDDAERRRASCLVVARAQIEKEKGGA